jgi:hypothetical protein
VLTAAQLAPQTMLGAAQAPTQCPDMQVEPAPQAMPQLPQFEASVATSTHPPPQVMVLPGQVATHVPAAQLGVAPLQAMPHAPQFFGSLESVTQAPVQLTCPVAHAPPSEAALASGVLDLVVLSPQPPAWSANTAIKNSEVRWLRRMKTSLGFGAHPNMEGLISCADVSMHLTADSLAQQKNHP